MHSGSELFDNSAIIGSATATDTYVHQFGIDSTTLLLGVDFYSGMQGEAIPENDGLAFSDMSAKLTLEFSIIDVATRYSFDLTVGPQPGNGESRFRLRTPNKTSVATLWRQWSRCKEERRGDKCRRGVQRKRIALPVLCLSFVFVSRSGFGEHRTMSLLRTCRPV